MAKLTMNNGSPELKLIRSSFNLSNQTVFDVEQNWLVPTAVYDCVPGDKFNLKTSHLIRTTPLVKPAMVIDLMAKTMSAFVPYRTIWKPFEEFFSGGRSGDKVVPLPFINFTNSPYCHSPYSLLDYFGLPNDSSNATAEDGKTLTFINALYILSYLKIWNDYFRNPSIDIEIDVLNLTIYKPNDDTPYIWSSSDYTFTYNGVSYTGRSVSSFVAWCLGLISNCIPVVALDSNSPGTYPSSTYTNYYKPALVNLPRDIFTSALPTASSSNPVSLGLSVGSKNLFSGSAFVTSDSAITGVAGLSSNLNSSGNAVLTSKISVNNGNISANTSTGAISGSIGISSSTSTPYNYLRVDGSNLNQMMIGSLNVSGIYPRELRLVFGLDLKQQIRNLTGNRYQDLLKAFYGVTTQDYRLNMSEYIGGGRSPIYTSEVLQTSESNETPLGEQAGHAISSGIHNHGSYFVRELGCIINLMWINSSLPYSQSLRRDWRKFTINDFFFPMFENLGDQEIAQEEINFVFKAPDTINCRIFGFAPRYSEYKFYNHTVCGGIRGNYKYWTQSRFYALPDSTSYYPVLSSDFIKPDLDSVNRIFQTIEGSKYTLKPYVVKFENRTIAYRPMVENSIGYLIDHF